MFQFTATLDLYIVKYCDYTRWNIFCIDTWQVGAEDRGGAQASRVMHVGRGERPIFSPPTGRPIARILLIFVAGRTGALQLYYSLVFKREKGMKRTIAPQPFDRSGVTTAGHKKHNESPQRTNHFRHYCYCSTLFFTQWISQNQIFNGLSFTKISYFNWWHIYNCTVPQLLWF